MAANKLCALENACQWEHSDNRSQLLETVFFLPERVNKSCERRKVSCRRHRSTGLATRLRVNRFFSSVLRPGSLRIFRRIRTTFFHAESLPETGFLSGRNSTEFDKRDSNMT